MQLTEALQVLAEYGREQDQAFEVLAANQNEVVYPIRLSDLSGVLNRYLNGELDQDDVEDWAMLMEARDEFDCAAIEDYLYALNNPELMGGISHETVNTMAGLLNGQIAGK